MMSVNYNCLYVSEDCFVMVLNFLLAFQEYESYYQVKFRKPPKLVKKIATEGKLKLG